MRRGFGDDSWIMLLFFRHFLDDLFKTTTTTTTTTASTTTTTAVPVAISSLYCARSRLSYRGL